MKSRQEILVQCYLNKTDIKKLLGISRNKATELFEIAKSAEEDRIGQYRPYENKVQIKTVMSVAGIDYRLLQKQIKG